MLGLILVLGVSLAADVKTPETLVLEEIQGGAAGEIHRFTFVKSGEWVVLVERPQWVTNSTGQVWDYVKSGRLFQHEMSTINAVIKTSDFSTLPDIIGEKHYHITKNPWNLRGKINGML